MHRLGSDATDNLLKSTSTQSYVPAWQHSVTKTFPDKKFCALQVDADVLIREWKARFLKAPWDPEHKVKSPATMKFCNSRTRTKFTSGGRLHPRSSWEGFATQARRLCASSCSLSPRRYQTAPTGFPAQRNRQEEVFGAVHYVTHLLAPHAPTMCNCLMY